MVDLKKICLGERKNFYSIFLVYENDEESKEILFSKYLDGLENYICGLRDGACNGAGLLSDLVIENGLPADDELADYVGPMAEDDFQRILQYINQWDNFQLAMGLSD
ncbi:hypothetical protein GOV03_02045 [Candidatus Woesearchaeota archaeon]|nr:hypothetical protein [Candidatus Woesearchaeota archaeon]